jgi:hypothetical protein
MTMDTYGPLFSGFVNSRSCARTKPNAQLLCPDSRDSILRGPDTMLTVTLPHGEAQTRPNYRVWFRLWGAERGSTRP